MPPWSAAPIPPDEQERLRRLARLGVGEGQRHEVLDHVTALASRILGAPIALVTLVEKERQLFLSRHGLDAAFTGRRESFCGHCVASRATLRVEDADLDERFAGGPLVVGAPGVRAYLGIPLLGGPGQSAIGTLCAIDHVPRAWTRDEETQLVHLAAVVENNLENVSVRRAFDDSPLSTVILDRHGRCVRINPAFARMLGHPVASLLDKSFLSLLLPADRGVFAAMLSHTVEQRTSPTRRELRYLKLSGEVVHGGARLAPFRDVDEQI
ncbi:MAG: GAF domain-containing protein, partial [Myxococcota bacterium]